MAAAALLPRLAFPAVLVIAVAANSLLSVALLEYGLFAALAVALVPAAVLIAGGLLTWRRSVLVFAALAVPISQNSLNVPLRGGVWVPDLLVVAALGSWLMLRLGGRAGSVPRWPRTPVLGWPFVLFAALVVVGILRGNAAHGQSLIGAPARLVLYAGIAAAIAGLTPRSALKGFTALFYIGTVWMFLNALYHLATGTSQTNAVDLSTGGTRVLSGTVSMWMAMALFLALLNLRLAASARDRALHATIATLAATCVALAYMRASLVPVALALPALFVASRDLRRSALSLLPLALPFVLLAALLLPRAAPDLVPTFVDRVTASPRSDANVDWRDRVNSAVFQQVRESPLVGVGFGRTASVTMLAPSSRTGLVFVRRETVTQEGHNDYIWFLAAGGGLLLGSFILLLVSYAVDLAYRLRHAREDAERTLLLWSAASMPVLLLPAAAGPVFGNPPVLLGIWTMLLLPAIVSRRARSDAAAGPRA